MFCIRLAAIYDIHANLPALEAVIQDLHQAKVDHLVVGGDVLPGPMPQETLERLLGLDIPLQFIQGNGDREVLAAIRGTENSSLPEQARLAVRWTAQQLHPEYEAAIAGWPKTLQFVIPGLGNVLFCHATPRNDTEIITRRTPDGPLLSLFQAIDSPVVVCGHTHMQFERMIGRTRIVNPGSVGMPFGRAGAYWLLFQPSIELRRTSYDLERAAARIRETSYPQAGDFATRNVLDPPSEAEMLDALSNLELR